MPLWVSCFLRFHAVLLLPVFHTIAHLLSTCCKEKPKMVPKVAFCWIHAVSFLSVIGCGT